MKEMIKKFVKSRSCMIWLILFLASTIFVITGLADFTGWALFNSSATLLALTANKAEQKINADAGNVEGS